MSTVTLCMAVIRPDLDDVLKYVLAAARQLHLPPSIYHRADLSNEENRRALVEYALGFAGSCAREKADELGWDPDDWGHDEIHPDDEASSRPRGQPKQQSIPLDTSRSFRNTDEEDA